MDKKEPVVPHFKQIQAKVMTITMSVFVVLKNPTETSVYHTEVKKHFVNFYTLGWNEILRLNVEYVPMTHVHTHNI